MNSEIRYEPWRPSTASQNLHRVLQAAGGRQIDIPQGFRRGKRCTTRPRPSTLLPRLPPRQGAGNETWRPSAPLEDHPLATHCEPSALYCWILEILYCTPKGRRALLRIPSTEGRSVCLCWAKSISKGPKGPTWGGRLPRTHDS